jgi:hypothetical protein
LRILAPDILVAVFAIGLAVAAFMVFLGGLVRDPRSFGNAVFLGLTLALGSLGVAERLADMPGRPERLLLLGLVLLVALGPFAVACYLVANGVTMARRESLRPANLLSLGAGIGILAVVGLDLVADRTGNAKLSLLSTVTMLLFGYVSFLLVSYVIYAWVYGLVAALVSRADYVIVLGAGLSSRGLVTPLLGANRRLLLAERDAAGVRGGVPPIPPGQPRHLRGAGAGVGRLRRCGAYPLQVTTHATRSPLSSPLEAGRR